MDRAAERAAIENAVSNVSHEEEVAFEKNPLVENELVDEGELLPVVTTPKKKRRKKKKRIEGEAEAEEEEEVPKEPENMAFTVVLIGAAGVGKSAVSLRYCSKSFPTKYEPTISDRYRKKLAVQGEEVTVDILDTAGQDEYSILPEQSLQEGNAFVIVYAVNNRESFDKTNEHFSELEQNRVDGDQVPVLLCANKLDLADQREVSTSEAQQKIEQWKRSQKDATVDNRIGEMEHIECSAKDNTGIDKVFESIVNMLIRQREDAKRMAAQQLGIQKEAPKSGLLGNCECVVS